MAKYFYEAVRNNDGILICKNKFKVAYEDGNFVYFKESANAVLKFIKKCEIKDLYDSEGDYFWQDFYISENQKLRENRLCREYIKQEKDMIETLQNNIELYNRKINTKEKQIEEAKAKIHPSVMIIGSNELGKAFSDLRIHANCLYRSKKHPDYEVWELMPEDFETLDFIKEEDWHKDWGWWRTGHCTFEGATDQLIIVNGKEMYAYAPQSTEKILNEVYPDLFTYLSDIFGVTTYYNRAYFATSLAKDNNMTLDEFMRIYQP